MQSKFNNTIEWFTEWLEENNLPIDEIGEYWCWIDCVAWAKHKGFEQSLWDKFALEVVASGRLHYAYQYLRRAAHNDAVFEMFFELANEEYLFEYLRQIDHRDDVFAKFLECETSHPWCLRQYIIRIRQDDAVITKFVQLCEPDSSYHLWVVQERCGYIPAIYDALVRIGNLMYPAGGFNGLSNPPIATHTVEGE